MPEVVPEPVNLAEFYHSLRFQSGTHDHPCDRYSGRYSDQTESQGPVFHVTKEEKNTVFCREYLVLVPFTQSGLLAKGINCQLFILIKNIAIFQQ